MRRWVLIVCSVLVAPLSSLRAAGTEDVYLDLTASGKGTYKIEGRFWTPGDAALVWAVLTDYDNLPVFIPSLQKSQVVEKFPDHLVLQQEAVGRALVLFHRHLSIRLAVRERIHERIDFEDIAKKDFKRYVGSWVVSPAAGGGMWVDYELTATPNFFAASFVARNAFRKMAKELLLAVQTEIIRRGELLSTFACCQSSEKVPSGRP